MTDQLCVLSSDQLELAVAPLGAEMQYLRNSQGQDLLWNGDAAYWTGRAPVLFPIVGRAVNDIVQSGGRTAEMKQHGFARRQVFALEDSSATRCQHTLTASHDTKRVYPFDFALTITHEIQEATLTVQADIANLGQTPMPFGFGFHPAFRWPLPGTSAPHHVTLADGSTPQQRLLHPDGLLSRDLIPGPFDSGDLEIQEALFENGALVFPGSAAPLRYGPKTGPCLEFTFENLPDLALWRPTGAPFLCIEPWHGTASHRGDGPEISKRPNSLSLDPGHTQSFRYRVTYLD